MKPGIGHSQIPGQDRLVGDALQNCHVLSMNPQFRESRDKSDGVRIQIGHLEFMADRWIQRPRFRDLVDAYKDSMGCTAKDVAFALELTPGTLNQYLYGKNSRPSEDAMRRASKLFGVSITELLDDPGVVLAGQELSETSEYGRFFATLIFQDIQAKDLTDGDRRILFEDWQRSKERLREIKSRGSTS